MSSIAFSLEVLDMAERMGATGFTLDEVAEVLEGSIDTRLLFETNSAIYKAYRKGYLKANLELRERIFKDAGHGSSPAQTLAKKIMDDCEYKLKQS